MINVEEYLQSGIVEDFCFGIASPQDVEQLMVYCDQYPQIKAFLDKTQDALETYARSFQRKPSDHTKEAILNIIQDNQKLEQARLTGENLMLEEFIGISKHSNIEKVEALIKDIQPPAEFDNIFAKPLFVSDTHELVLVWARELVPDETHEDVDECFLLLDGTADCYIEDKVFHMKRGDFMRIPLYTKHKVVITSNTPAKAIRSRILLGA